MRRKKKRKCLKCFLTLLTRSKNRTIMKKILYILLLTVSSGYAQEVTNDRHQVVCYIQKDGTVENKSHKILGYITSTTIETPTHQIVGYIDENIIEDEEHKMVGVIRKASIQGTEYMNIGYIKDNTILDDEHEIIGYFTNVDPKLVAIYFFFFN